MSCVSSISQYMLLCHKDCSANLLELSWWEKYNVTFNSFHNFHLHSVNRWYVFFQITCTFQRFIKVALVAFVWLFSTVYFQMCPQAVFPRWCKVTLCVFKWFLKPLAVCYLDVFSKCLLRRMHYHTNCTCCFLLACQGGCKVTLTAFVCLFSTVAFKCPQ